MQSVSAAFLDAVVAPVRRIAQRVQITFLNSALSTGMSVDASEGDAEACPQEALIDGREQIWGDEDTENVYAWPDYYDEEEDPTELILDDFETGDLSKWDLSQNVTVQSTVKNSGTYSAEFNYDGENESYLRKTILAEDEFYGEFYIQFASFPSTAYTPIHFVRYLTDEICSFSIQPDGYLLVSLANLIELQQETNENALSLDTQYKIKYSLVATSSSTWTLNWSIDDVAQTELSISAAAPGGFTEILFDVGDAAPACHFYIDDIVIRNASEGGATLAFYFPSDHLFPVPEGLIWESEGISGETPSGETRPQYAFDTPEVLTLDYGHDVNLTKVTWVSEENQNCFPSNFTIEYYDGANWADIGCGEVDRPALTIGDMRWEYELAENIQTSSIRMTVNAIEAPKRSLKLSEFGAGFPVDVSAGNEDRVIRWEILKELTSEANTSSPMGNASSNSLALELDNTDGAFFRGSGSDFVPYLKANRMVQVLCGLVLEDGTTELLPQGIFYTVSWSADQDSSTCWVVAWDRSKLMKETTFDSVVRSGYTISELVELIGDDFGLLPQEMVIDATTEVVPYAFFDSKSHWACLVELAQAEGGWVFFDELNRLTFYNRAHMTGGSVVATLTDEDTVISGGEGWEQLKMRNSVRVIVKPLTVQATTQVYTAADVITVPAGGTKTVMIDFSTRPVINPATPVVTGGADISIDSWTPYSWGGMLVLANAGGTDETVTAITCDGDPLAEAGGFKATKENATLIAENGRKTYPVENNMIQSLTVAEQMASDLLAVLEDPASERPMSGRGRPELQLADLVHVTNARMAIDADQWLTRIRLSYDGGLKMDCTIVEAEE